MQELIIASCTGSAFGLLAGVLPGIGAFATVAILYPLLLDWSPISIIIFYFSLVSSSQYFGSIPAIYLGISGESSSFPAVIEGHTLAKRGYALEAIWVAGIGSFIGAIVGLMFLFLAGYWFSAVMLTTTKTLIFFIITACILFFINKNKWYVSIGMLVLAIALSHLGVSANNSIPLYSFGLSWLSSGINYFPLAAGLICMKEVFGTVSINKDVKLTSQKFSYWYVFWSTKWSIIRGAVTGAVGGLVPGITTVASSHLAYGLEKWKHKKTYSKGHMPSLAASETANNSGSITQLIPLLMFGLPITGSETIIYNILDSKGWTGNASSAWSLVTEHWWILLSVNIVALFLATKAARLSLRVIPSNASYIKLLVFFLLAASVYITGNNLTSTGELDLIFFVLATVVGIRTPTVN